MSETNFQFILQRLSSLNVHDVYALQSIEQEVSLLLNNDRDNVSGLTALLKTEVLLGKPQKARVIAEKIWNIGGILNKDTEFNYIDSLLNLGLVEMSTGFLKNHFTSLPDSLDRFYPVLLKFSIMTGNINLLEKILNFRENTVIRDLVEVYKISDYVEHFRNIQKLILNEVKNTLCRYEYNFYNDRGFTDLEVVLFVEDADVNKIWQNIDTKIDFYHLTNRAQRMYNLGFVVKDVNTK